MYNRRANARGCENTVSEQAAYVSDRKDGAVTVGAQQVITKEVEASERNARLRECFDATMQGLILRFPRGN